MLPVKDYDSDWALCVLRDLESFFEANEMPKSAAAMSGAHFVVAGEIRDENRNLHFLDRPDVQQKLQ